MRFATVMALLVNNTKRIHVFFNCGSKNMRRHGLSPFVLYKAGINQTRHALITPFLRKQARIYHCAKLFRIKGKKSKGINLHQSVKNKLTRVPMRGKFTAESTRTQHFKSNRKCSLAQQFRISNSSLD